MLNRPTYIEQGVCLQSFNTLAISVKAKYFASIDTPETLLETLAWADREQLPLLVIGGGSNIVLCQDWDGLVLRLTNQALDVLEETDQDVLIRVGAGGNWHQLVMQCTANGWHGLENLALIPGSVGAAPVQNIGAYGVELNAFVEAVDVVDIHTGEPSRLSNEACQFGYRDSVFKRQYKGRFIITTLQLRLLKTFSPVLSYPALSHLALLPDLSAETLIQTVIEIRQSKLPDPTTLPNAGSFFKNPIVDNAQLMMLLERDPSMPYYPVEGGCAKLAAGWLIDKSGWRGRSLGPVAMHAQQALVLINPEGGSAKDVIKLANAVSADVAECFGVTLEIEPRCVGAVDG